MQRIQSNVVMLGNMSQGNQTFNEERRKTKIEEFFVCFVLFAIFILHSRESELYRYTLDGKSALAWELSFSRFMGHLSST